MLNVDRHLTIQAGWVAGPAFGVAMMAAPDYLKLGPPYSGLLFWGGIAVFLLTVAVIFVLSLHEETKRKAVLGPIINDGGRRPHFLRWRRLVFLASRSIHERSHSVGKSCKEDR
jgi:hypothetical protein